MYVGFARMYDAFMKDVPYDNWASYINKILKGQKCILDLACGTGNMTLRLAQMGYDMIGVDVSEDMLAEAQQKAFEAQNKKVASPLCRVWGSTPINKKQILFLAQDMRHLDLYGTVDGVVCVCDALNYILSSLELLQVFKRVRLFLNTHGVFIFDINTEYKYNELLANYSFEAKNQANESYIWQNNFNPKTKINEYKVLFKPQGWEKPFMEIHHQKAYSISEITKLLKETGFSDIQVKDNYTNNDAHEKTERATFIVK